MALLIESKGYLILLFMLPLLSLLVYLILPYMNSYRAYSLSKNKKLMNISELINGKKGRISGTVDSNDSLTSPLSKTKCSWFSLDTQKYVSSKNSSYWKSIRKDSSGDILRVSDSTGKIDVHPYVKNYFTESSKYYWKPESSGISMKNIAGSLLGMNNAPFDPSNEGTLTHEKDLPKKSFFGQSYSYRYVESLVKKGDNVLIEGIVENKDGNKMIVFSSPNGSSVGAFIVPSKEVLKKVKISFFQSLGPLAIIIFIMLLFGFFILMTM